MALAHLNTPLAQRKERQAHNLEVTRSKLVGGIRQSLRDAKLAFHRCGAEEARGAHNSEVTRSKRVVGIIINSHRCIKALEHFATAKHSTGIAQRQSV